MRRVPTTAARRMQRINPIVRHAVFSALTTFTYADVQCDVLAPVTLHELFTNGIYGYIVYAGEYGLYVYTSMYGVLPFNGVVMVGVLDVL